MHVVQRRQVKRVFLGGVHVLTDRVLRSDEVVRRRQVRQQRRRLVLQEKELVQVGLHTILHPLVVLYAVDVRSLEHGILALAYPRLRLGLLLLPKGFFVAS